MEKRSWRSQNYSYIIDINQFFPSGGAVPGMMEYNVYVDLNTKTSHWDLHDKFWSFE